MDAGSVMAAHGDGGRVNAEFVRSGRRRTFLSSGSMVILESTRDSVPLDGCPSGRAIHSSRGGVVSVSESASLVSVISIDLIFVIGTDSTGDFQARLNRCATGDLMNAFQISVRRNAIRASCGA